MQAVVQAADRQEERLHAFSAHADQIPLADV